MSNLTFDTIRDPYQTWLPLDPAFPPFELGTGRGPDGVPVVGDDRPAVKPAGSFERIPGTGTRVYVGPDVLVSDGYRVKVLIHGHGTREEESAALNAVKTAALRTAWIQKGGRELPIAGVSNLGETIRSVPGWAELEITFEPAVAYWLDPPTTFEAVQGINTVQVNGDMPVPLLVEIAAVTDTVNPSVTTDAGTLTFNGTVPAGQTLVIDGTPGVYSATLNGVNVRAKLTGFQPRLRTGVRPVTVNAANATTRLTWREGWL